MEMPELPEAPKNDGDAGSSESPDDSTMLSYRHLQMISVFATLLVAVSAIGLSVWQGVEMRRHNRLSVLPYISNASLMLSEDSTYRYLAQIENTGLGPAVFERILVYESGAGPDDEPVLKLDEPGDRVSLYTKDAFSRGLEKLPFDPDQFTAPLRQGYMLQSGETLSFYRGAVTLSAVDSTLGFPPRRMRDAISTHSYVVCYCSVYGEDCQSVSLGADPPASPCRN